MTPLPDHSSAHSQEYSPIPLVNFDHPLKSKESKREEEDEEVGQGQGQGEGKSEDEGEARSETEGGSEALAVV